MDNKPGYWEVRNLFPLLLLLCFLGRTTPLPAQTGNITGVVTDRETESPLPGVNVIVRDTDYGAATDEAGRYIIDNIPAGTYNLVFRMIGYESIEKLNVPVSPDRYTQMNASLPLTTLEGEEIVVEARAFTKARDAVVSDHNVDYTEISRDPGGAYDVQRVMQALPSVVSGSDQNNEIIVRGGEPNENLFLIDNIEIPNPNHFGEQGAGGGPISLINPAFVSDVDFYAGAFPARYGGKASSVMDIHLKEGSREKHHMNLDMGMSGVGLFAEGPLTNGSASYMLGFQKSYLDLVVNSIGLTAIPKYYSLQGKVAWDLSPRTKLLWNGLYGNDAIYIDNSDGGYVPESTVADVGGWEYATGLSLKTLYDENRYSLLTVSNVGNQWNLDVGENTTEDFLRDVYAKDDWESEWTVKGDYFHRINDRNDFMLGANIKAIQFRHLDWAARDTVWGYAYFYAGDPTPRYFTVGNPWESPPDSFAIDQMIQIDDEWRVNENINTSKYAVYGQYKWRPVPKMLLTAGLRYSYFAYSGYPMLSPRAGFSYNFTAATSLNFGYGKHFQEPASIDFTANPEKNRDLKSRYSEQYVVGLEHLFRDDMKGSVEIYHRNYGNLPYPRSWVEQDSLANYNNEMYSTGSGYAQGFEFFLQKKLSRNFNLTISYSHYTARRRDLRREKAPYYTADYDFRDVFTMIGGYRWKMTNYSWYQNVRDNPLWKIFSWLISPGDEFELSFRWRYTRGKPYTERTYDPYLRRWYTRWGTTMNTERLRAYHRLDLLILRRWLFKGSALVTYLDIMNIYGRHNIWDYTYYSDGTREAIYQYSLFPVGGFVLEF